MKWCATILLSLSALLLTPSALADAEIESNDTPSSANTLTSGVVVSGHLSSPSDIDYFKITVGGSGTLVVKTTGYVYTGSVTVLNSDQQVIGSGDLNSSSQFSVGLHEQVSSIVLVPSHPRDVPLSLALVPFPRRFNRSHSPLSACMRPSHAV